MTEAIRIEAARRAATIGVHVVPSALVVLPEDELDWACQHRRVQLPDGRVMKIEREALFEQEPGA